MEEFRFPVCILPGFYLPESFILMESIVIVSMVVLGGMGNIYGVIVGAVLLYAIPEILRLLLGNSRSFLGSEVVPDRSFTNAFVRNSLVAIMLFKPMGLFPKNKNAK